MTTLISNASGNLTGAATFAAVETGSLALNLVRNQGNALGAATSTTSDAFTVTNAAVIDGVLLFVQQAGVSTGTFKVDLRKGGVSQASVTVNKSDLPSFYTPYPPVFFKFTGTAVGDGGANWTIVLTTTGTGNINWMSASATPGVFTKALRTTTAATPAATDNLFVLGELTGAGTHNSLTVTMDSTAATAYGSGAVNSTTVYGGGVHIGCWGTLSYGTAASTNYILRINGDLAVYQFGTLNIGSSGAEIPRTSTAVLEFQQTASDCQFGLLCYHSSTINSYGLSRTSGKNVTQCKLTANVSGSLNLISTGGLTNATQSTTVLDPCGISPIGMALTDNGTNATHGVYYPATTVNNTTQTCSVWLAQGSGTNNRYVRVTMGNATVQSSVTNGFYADVDLLLGTVGTVTAVGTGTATNVSIVASKRGWLIRMTGKVSSGSAATNLLLNACSAAATLSFAGASNQCFFYDHVAVVTAASISDTTFSVDTDTGWLADDVIVAVTTSQSTSETELYPLNADAGSSSFTSAMYPYHATIHATHSGVYPTQAELGLLTRNVKIRSTSATLMTYMYCERLASVTMQWTEFHYLGASVGDDSKNGIYIQGGATTAAKSFTYCSMHDGEFYGIHCQTAGTSLNLTVSNCVMWNYIVPFYLQHAYTNTDWTFSGNLLVANRLGTSEWCVILGDIGGTFTNNALVGNFTNYSLEIGEHNLLGTFTGNTIHSSAGWGMRISVRMKGTFGTLTIWRMGGYGVYHQLGASSDIIYDSPVMFGNSSAAILANDHIRITGTGIMCGDSTFAQPYAVVTGGLGSFVYDISGVDFNPGTGIFVANSAYDLYNSSFIPLFWGGPVNNCKFGPNPYYYHVGWAYGSYLTIQKYNQVAGDHRTQMYGGVVKTDATVYNTAAPSMRMTPLYAVSVVANTPEAAYKLPSAPRGKGILVSVTSGNTVTATVYVRKDAAYNGSQPRLIVRANSAVGIVSDTVLATYSAGTGSWNALSGTTPAATDDGAFEFIVDCDGTAGYINVDDWSAS